MENVGEQGLALQQLFPKTSYPFKSLDCHNFHF